MDGRCLAGVVGCGDMQMSCIAEIERREFFTFTEKTESNALMIHFEE